MRKSKDFSEKERKLFFWFGAVFSVFLLGLFLSVSFYFYQKKTQKIDTFSFQNLKTQVINQTTQTENDKYESVYQIPLKLPYCSSDSNGGQFNVYPCYNNSTYPYLHYKTYTGFKEQWNPNDPIRRCQQEPGTTCPEDSSGLIEYTLSLASADRSKGVVGDLFRYYIPKGTKYVGLNLYGPSPAGKCVTLARFGKPPESSFPSSFDPFLSPEAYPEYFPPEQYSRGDNDLWGGKSVDQLTQNDWFAINESGHITVVSSNATSTLSEGNWLYIKFKRYDNSQIPSHKFFWGADKTTYTNWYNSFTSYDSKGDPAFGKNSTSLPGDIEPQSSPDGDVDIFDYNIFIQYWSQSPTNNPADIDQNGTVDIFDYNLLVGNFGKKI